MQVYGKNVAREILNSNYNIKNIYLVDNFNNEELINLINKKHMETGEISEKLGRGKHTTRHSELIEIEDGFLVDTPGFSTLGLDFIDKDDLKYCFPEFENYNDSCKFKGCNHYKEPNCAVKKNVEENNINRLRYEFYVKTLEEIMNRRVTKW